MWLTNCGVAPAGCALITVEQMWSVILRDLKWALSRRGETMLKQTKGVPTGSPTGPFLANLVASFLEQRLQPLVK